MSHAIVPAAQYGVPELQVMARSVAQSRLFPGIESEQAAFTLMMLCQAEGLHPIQAMRRYHVIKGRPSMRADAMQAEFQRQNGVIRWERSDNEECTARFVHPTHAPEPGVSITLTMQQAVAYGLAGNDLYRKFPDQMLRARVISQGVRMVLPGVVVGIYTPEEVEGTPADPATDAGPARHVEARVVEPPKAIEPPPTDTRAAVNEAFKPAGRADEPPARPAHDKEAVKFPGDRIGARGLDTRDWTRLREQEVARVNARLAAFLLEHGLEPAEATGSPRAINHMASWAEEMGAEIPAKVNGKGETVRAELGKVEARLGQLYLDPRWRGPMREELARYLAEKLGEALQVAEDQAQGDPPGPDEGQGELAAVGAGEGSPEAWEQGRE